MTSLTAFEACQIFLAIKTHFTSDSYDFFKYDGKLRLSPESFDKRPDKYTFHKLSKKYKKEDYLPFIVANILKVPSLYSRDLLTEDSEFEFKQYQKKLQSMEYTFAEEVKWMKSKATEEGCHIDSYITVPQNSNPRLLSFYHEKKISLESLIIMNQCLGGYLFKHWDKHIGDDLVWPKFKKLAMKYSAFIPIADIGKYKEYIKEK